MLNFPCWMVRLEPLSALLPFAFSTRQRLSAYLDVRKDRTWKIQLVNRYSAANRLAELNEQGHSAIALDPAANGDCSETILIATILDDLGPRQ